MEMKPIFLPNAKDPVMVRLDLCIKNAEDSDNLKILQSMGYAHDNSICLPAKDGLH